MIVDAVTGMGNGHAAVLLYNKPIYLFSPRDHCHRWHRLPLTTGASSSEARCQQATTCRRRGVAYLRRAPAPCAVGVGCGAAPPLAGWLLAAWLPACVTVTEYRIDAGLRQQNLSFYEGGQQNDEGGQNRYNCTSTYCTGTDVRGCKQLYAAVPVYSCT